MSQAAMALASAALYLAGAALLTWGLARRHSLIRAGGIGLGLLAAVLHAAAVIGEAGRIGGINADFFSILSLVSLLIVAVILIASVRFALAEILILAFPLAALLLLVRLTIAPEPRVLDPTAPGIALHVISSLLAFSLLSIAALNALLISVQDRVLRRHRAVGMLELLPPLAVMEKLLFQLIGAGWLIMTVGLVAGLMFVDNLFAQHLVHKSVLSLIAWVVFGLVLVGRWRYGWRGMRAVRLTLIGMAVLLLAYFGSKAVLELILDRGWYASPPA